MYPFCPDNALYSLGNHAGMEGTLSYKRILQNYLKLSTVPNVMHKLHQVKHLGQTSCQHGPGDLTFR